MLINYVISADTRQREMFQDSYAIDGTETLLMKPG
jgi:hypothetical protein